jgi:hypothetical protein
MQTFITSVKSPTVGVAAPRGDVQGSPIGKRVRLGAAVLGAGLLVGMAALTLACSGNEAQAMGAPPPTSGSADVPIAGGAGSTITQTPAPSTPAIASASPTAKADPWKGGWSGR